MSIPKYWARAIRKITAVHVQYVSRPERFDSISWHLILRLSFSRKKVLLSVTATAIKRVSQNTDTMIISETFLQCTFSYLGFPEHWMIWRYKLTLNPQVTLFWEKVLDKEAKERLVSNIAGHLKDAKEFLQKRAVSIHVWNEQTTNLLSLRNTTSRRLSRTLAFWGLGGKARES